MARLRPNVPIDFVLAYARSVPDVEAVETTGSRVPRSSPAGPLARAVDGIGRLGWFARPIGAATPPARPGFGHAGGGSPLDHLRPGAVCQYPNPDNCESHSSPWGISEPLGELAPLCHYGGSQPRQKPRNKY